MYVSEYHAKIFYDLMHTNKKLIESHFDFNILWFFFYILICGLIH